MPMKIRDKKAASEALYAIDEMVYISLLLFCTKKGVDTSAIL